MNMNSNAIFSKWIKKKHLPNLNMPVLLMFKEYEFVFSIPQAIKRVKHLVKNLEFKILNNSF